MAGIFTAVSALNSIFDAIKTTKDDPTKALDEYKKLKKRLPALASDGSITKFLSSFIVEPVVIITKDARETEVADKLALLNTDIFASFYLQAFHALADLHGFDPMVAVDVLGTDTSSMFGAVVDKSMPGLINFGVSKLDRRDYFGELISPNSKYLSFSCEASKYNANDILEQFVSDTDKFWEYFGCCNKEQQDYLEASMKAFITKTIVGKDNTKMDFKDLDVKIKIAKKKGNNQGLTEASFRDLCKKVSTSYTYKGPNAVSEPPKTKKEIESITVDNEKTGYVSNKIADDQAENLYYVNHRDLKITLNIKYNNGDTKTVIVPITIKTHIIVTHIDQILNMLKPNDRTKKFGYRLDEWKAGAISLKELIFCGDLIDSYKKNKLKDKEGLLDIVKKREESANSKLITHDLVGFEKYYNMLIVTADEKVLLNKHIGGDILNERYKQELLTEAHALTLSVVDQDYERVYILTKDIRGRSDVTFKAIAKKSNKESDSTDILKALIANRPPVF